jgi:hypothetical protein
VVTKHTKEVSSAATAAPTAVSPSNICCIACSRCLWSFHPQHTVVKVQPADTHCCHRRYSRPYLQLELLTSTTQA